MGLDRRDHVVTEAQVKAIYVASTRNRPGDCPPPEALQALARREGSEESRLATLDHAMSCGSCRAELDLLRTIDQAGAATGGSAARRGGRRAWFVPAALAATVLLAVGVGRMALGPSGSEPVRSGDEAGVAVLAPAAEAPVGEPLVFAWRPVAGAARYRVEVLGAGGEVAIEAETRDTTVTIDGVRRLAPGDYRWWVVALTPRPGPRSALRPLRLSAR
jgi:hypothetical protein